MTCEKYFSKFFESIKPRRKVLNIQLPNVESDCLPTEIQHDAAAPIHEVNFTWTIDELDIHIKKKEFLKSCKFSATTDDKCKWRLICLPDKCKWCLVCLPYKCTSKWRRLVCLPHGKRYKNFDDLVSIYACLLFIPDRTDAKALVKSDICFLNSQQEEVFRSPARSIVKFDSNQVLHMPIRLKKKHILPGNKLTIRLNLTYTKIYDSVSDKNNTPPPRQLQIPKSEHLEKFASLYREEKFKDVLISVKGKNYLAHKATLAAYSLVFDAIFKEHEKKEKITRVRVKISDVNEEVFGEMLTCINTGKLSFENATELFILANEFGIAELQFKMLGFINKKYRWYGQN